MQPFAVTSYPRWTLLAGRVRVRVNPGRRKFPLRGFRARHEDDSSMGTRRPIIAVTGPERGGAAAGLATAVAVWCAGGRPIRITPARPLPSRRFDALIIGGGADVAPELYGEQDATHLDDAVSRSSTRWSRRLLTVLLLPLLWLLRVTLRSGHRIPRDDARDRLESGLIEDAEARGVPMLGICRGAQLINVQRGGTLYRDLAEYYMESTQITTLLPFKQVALEPESRLAAIVGRTRMNVNSLHRHAVRETGAHIRIVASEDNGVVQAIEDSRHPFVIGVQWHPEYLPQRPEQRRLFRALVHAAREARSERAR
jgi:putative glutamine amidotransferase